MHILTATGGISMHITYNKEHRIWIAHTQYGEHTAVKKAGFWWHPQVGRCRYSKCKACAAGLVKVWWSFKRLLLTRMEASI